MNIRKVINLLGFNKTFLLVLLEYFGRYAKKWDNMSPDKGKVTIEQMGRFTSEETDEYDASITKFAHDIINPTPGATKPKPHDNESTPERIICERGQSINDDLRQDIVDIKIKEASESIGQKYKLKVDLVVYRGVYKHTMENAMQEARKLKKTKKEKVDFYEKGFLYSSLTKVTHLQGREYDLRIFIPKGTCAFYSGNVNGEKYSHEIVVQRGSKLKIKSVDKQYINCELIGTDSY